MSKTLNLAECLLAMGRDLHALGRLKQASGVLHRLVGLREVPQPILEQAHSLLAELHISRHQPKKARRHLTILLFYRPSNAAYYHRMGLAILADAKADPRKAVRYFKQAIQLEPNESRCISDYAKLLQTLGNLELAAEQHCVACELSPSEPVYLARMIECLCLADRPAEAKEMLRVARFRNPRDARFRKLWNDFLYREVAEEQTVEPAPLDEPVCLPFVARNRVAAHTEPPLSGRTIRLDSESVAKPHLPDAGAKRGRRVEGGA